MKLQQAIIVQPLGLPTLTRDQKPNEIVIGGDLGFYFVSKEKPKLWRYDYFGIHNLGSGYSHTRKDSCIAMCKARLNAQTW